MELNKTEIEDLKEILEEYIGYFHKLKGHKKAHKKEPCRICDNAKRILRKIGNCNKIQIKNIEEEIKGCQESMRLDKKIMSRRIRNYKNVMKKLETKYKKLMKIAKTDEKINT